MILDATAIYNAEFPNEYVCSAGPGHDMSGSLLAPATVANMHTAAR